MTSTTPETPVSDDLLRNPPDFSLIQGGPLFQMLCRAHMWGEARELLERRMLFFALLTWLPLFLLSALGGELWAGGEGEVPFLKEVIIHVRFLVAVPLLIAAEIMVHRRMRSIVAQFLERKLIPVEAMARFEAAIASTLRLRNSVAAEVLLLTFVFTAGYLISSSVTVAAGWRTTGQGLTAAGYWYVLVSIPLFQFLLLRWYFRLFLWIRFLWLVSRIPLKLMPTHPDRLGGLSFVAGTLEGFVPLALAHGAMLAGLIADRIFHTGAGLLQFRVEIGLLVAFLICLLTAPLLFFSYQLLEAKRLAKREYGTLAQRYVREFDQKWLRGGAPADEELIGSGDIQSLADLGNSFEVVRGMRVIPVTRDSVVMLALATVLPIAPLLLTIMPLEELLKKALALVL